MVSRTSMMDYYKELGVNKHATSADIRTAYKRLALTWHPDRNKAKDAEEKFKKIKQAYDVLIDDNQRRDYDRKQQQNRSYQSTRNMNYSQPNQEQFNLHTFEPFMSASIDPFDILHDIQFFQDTDFTSKMMNSPSYRNLYTHIFNTMNNPSQKRSSSPIFLNNDRLFRSPPKTRTKHHPQPKHSPVNPIPVIHSTMANDWFLNELIDLHEQQNFVFIPSSHSSFANDPFFNDLTHCTNCHRNISTDRTRLIQHEQQCRQNPTQYPTNPSKFVRV